MILLWDSGPFHSLAYVLPSVGFPVCCCQNLPPQRVDNLMFLNFFAASYVQKPELLWPKAQASALCPLPPAFCPLPSALGLASPEPSSSMLL